MNKIKVSPRKTEVKNAPIVKDPVEVSLSIKVAYNGTGKLQPVEHIYCSDKFSNVLDTIEKWCRAKDYIGIVHLGIYNSRPARNKDGSSIKPERWSDHAFAEGIDLSGILNKFNVFVPIYKIKKEDLQALFFMCTKTVEDNLKEVISIVDEGAWVHISISHKKEQEPKKESKNELDY